MIEQQPEAIFPLPLMQELQLIEAQINQGQMTVTAVDKWIEEPRTEVGMRLAMGPMSPIEIIDFTRKSNIRYNLAVQRLLPYDLLPISVLPKQVRDEYAKVEREGTPPHPLLIVRKEQFDQEGDVNLEHLFRDNKVKGFKYIKDPMSDVAYLKACGYEEFRLQLVARDAHDSKGEELSIRDFLKRLREN